MSDNAEAMGEAPGKVRVILVDDEPIILDVFKRAFRRDFEHMTAPNGHEGLALIEAHPFDVLLADYAMPGMNGVELLRRVAEVAPKVKRVLVTAHFEHPEVREAQRSGLAAAVIAKPWQRSNILECVAQLVPRSTGV